MFTVGPLAISTALLISGPCTGTAQKTSGKCQNHHLLFVDEWEELKEEAVVGMKKKSRFT